MDNELFELCKQVRYKTDWYEANLNTPNEFTIMCMEKILDKFVSLYTSDYLLEKLPNVSLQRDELTNEWIAQSSVGSRVRREWDDTPLKALLKLTIALAEAGELS